MRGISKVENPQTAVEIIRLALLASYNENRKITQVITNEDAPQIWLKRAESVLRDIENVRQYKSDTSISSVSTGEGRMP